MEVLRGILGHLGEDAVIVPPFYCDKGAQIYIGKGFYANTGLLILDEADVRIGDHVFIAPRVSIYTAAHPIDAEIRRTELEYAKSVSIGNDVWIGGNVVIGSGSVVTKDIPDGVIAVGNPCKVLRKITKADKDYWTEQAEEYYADADIR